MKIDKKQNKGDILFAIFGVIVLIIAVAGSTYAYFTASATTTGNPISGETLDISLGVTATRVSKGTGKLIPIYDGTVSGHASQLSTAASSTYDCVDKNGYTVCQIYEIKITNTGGDSTTFNTSLTLTGTANLKWANMSNRTTVGTLHTTGDQNIASNTPITANGNVTQYIMVYVNNTGENQTSEDGAKDFTGTITVTASTGARVEATF